MVVRHRKREDPTRHKEKWNDSVYIKTGTTSETHATHDVQVTLDVRSTPSSFVNTLLVDRCSQLGDITYDNFREKTIAKAPP